MRRTVRWRRRRGYLFGLLGALATAYVVNRIVLIARWRRGDRALIDQVRRFNRRWTNPTAKRYLRAGERGSPYALVGHVGRRSGRAYTTPVIVARVGDGFVIPLAYGDDVDWHRNLQAAGNGELRWQGITYSIGPVAPVEAAAALQAFPVLWRAPLRAYGISHFVKAVPTRAGAVPAGEMAAAGGTVPMR